MVNPVKGLNFLQNILRSGKGAEAPAAKESGQKNQALVRDEVVFSEAALDLSQARETAVRISAALKDNPDIILGLNPDFAT